jgi:tetratricopeptide (TPR) repeat protein
MRQLELALELDPLSIPVHINVAWGRERLWDWDGAEQVLLRLIDLADYKQPWRARYAFHLLKRGLVDRSREQIELAVSAAPSDPTVVLTYGIILRLTRQNERAIEPLEAASAMMPTNEWCHIHLGLAYLFTGRLDDAQDELGHEAVLSSEYGEFWLRILDTRTGHPERARTYLAEAESGLHDAAGPFVIAGLCAALGERDSMFRWLDKAYENHAVLLPVITLSPFFDDYRSDPRYRALVVKMGLAS